jgi:2-polyprenyl-6-hydroxyphenyl methylase/3-demethylubiquinone-9 3-methyltransferase
MASTSVDPAEIAKFSAMADEWWDRDGKFRPLHMFNPVRLAFIRAQAAAKFGREASLLRPFEGLSLLDIGCGGGLIAEPMARMGFAVTGIDAAEKNITVASAHAHGAGLDLTYRHTTVEDLVKTAQRFDVVLNLEVVEHVSDLAGFVRDSAALVAPGGMMVVATLNRTLKSLALAKLGAEYVLRWLPPGTHDWEKFVQPGELHRHIENAGLSVTHTQGVAFDLLRWDWRLSDDTDVNYMKVAERR